ncbi:MAG: PEP-CTERM sorting domain-containing protein [Myxococcota bacterium]|nr:PEP-CTERM sorting domain-containing protein [Myxococcota bacterium]
MTSNYSNGTILTTGDTVTVTVNFDTQGAADISLLSVSVLFDDAIMSWDSGTSPGYALYVSGGKGNQYLVPATTNLTLRTGTSNQILMDWQNTALPGGNRDPGSFDMATLVFSVSDVGGGIAAFTLSNSSPGNILQLADGSNPANALSGDFNVITPEPTTALLVGLGLAGLGVAGRRRS